MERPGDADVDIAVGDHMALALSGRVLPVEDRRVLAAFAAQAAVVLDRQRLQSQADHARKLAEGNRIRTALLAAVSHDLRTPLPGIKASGPFRLGQRADQGKVPAMLESSEVNRRGLLAG